MCTNLTFRLLRADLSYVLFQSCYLRHPVDVQSERCISPYVCVILVKKSSSTSAEMLFQRNTLVFLQHVGHCNQLLFCFVLIVSYELAIKQTADKSSIFPCGFLSFLLKCFTLQPFKLASSRSCILLIVPFTHRLRKYVSYVVQTGFYFV